MLAAAADDDTMAAVVAAASACPLVVAVVVVDCEEVDTPLPLEPFDSTPEVDAHWVAWLLLLLVADLAAAAPVVAHH